MLSRDTYKTSMKKNYGARNGLCVSVIDVILASNSNKNISV